MQTFTQGVGGFCVFIAAAAAVCVNSKRELPNWDYSRAESILFFSSFRLRHTEMNGKLMDAEQQRIHSGEHVLILSAGTFNGGERAALLLLY